MRIIFDTPSGKVWDVKIAAMAIVTKKAVDNQQW